MKKQTVAAVILTCALSLLSFSAFSAVNAPQAPAGTNAGESLKKPSHQSHGDGDLSADSYAQP